MQPRRVSVLPFQRIHLKDVLEVFLLSLTFSSEDGVLDPLLFHVYLVLFGIDSVEILPHGVEPA